MLWDQQELLVKTTQEVVGECIVVDFVFVSQGGGTIVKFNRMRWRNK